MQEPEVWLRGPVTGIIDPLQPVAHALLQAMEEVQELMKDFDDDTLWQRPAQLASTAFHLQHMRGVLDRLFTYAMKQSLSELQLLQLDAEGKYDANVSANQLVEDFCAQVQQSILRLKEFSVQTLYEPRYVGRKQLPSTLFGLIVHAAEHTMRHLGQLLVTVRVLAAARK